MRRSSIIADDFSARDARRQECSMKCGEKVDIDARQSIFNKFYSMQNKNEQDIYLQGLTETRNIKQQRKRNPDGESRSRSYSLQIDTCNRCEELSVKIKSASLMEAAKKVTVAEKMIHERRSKMFYTMLKNTAVECKKRDDLAAVAFDYMQNLQLPFIPVQDLFYLTQLSVLVFCIHDLKTDKAYFYVHPENIASKGPVEVYSFLLDFIENYLPPAFENCDSFRIIAFPKIKTIA
ncbi:hypothetical protein ILUMI_03357 [Ignelater luminosus]|uniref:Uncharacterized protein n=1 Tax=Ignelater luminosus TaxID=2038154 RepID=A0A8K0DLZ2_IGNLU|nr:hypothetical protein ILUMI_03357 [Ignelater luminosus]